MPRKALPPAYGNDQGKEFHQVSIPQPGGGRRFRTFKSADDAKKFYAAVALILTFVGLSFGLHGVALWPAVVLHSVMAIWCIVCLRREFVPT